MIEGLTRTFSNRKTIRRNKPIKILHISNPLVLSNGDSKTTTSHVYRHVDIEEATNAYVRDSKRANRKKYNITISIKVQTFLASTRSRLERVSFIHALSPNFLPSSSCSFPTHPNVHIHNMFSRWAAHQQTTVLPPQFTPFHLLNSILNSTPNSALPTATMSRKKKITLSPPTPSPRP